MKIDDFLARLQKVRKTGANNWIACCPAHGDKNPSMTVGVGDNLGVLVHCFAGCSADEIVGSLGLELHDLMPDKPLQGREYIVARARTFPAADVLEAVADETFYVAFMAAALANAPAGYGLNDTDRALLWQSYDRIMEARRLALGGR